MRMRLFAPVVNTSSSTNYMEVNLDKIRQIFVDSLMTVSGWIIPEWPVNYNIAGSRVDYDKNDCDPRIVNSGPGISCTLRHNNHKGGISEMLYYPLKDYPTLDDLCKQIRLDLLIVTAKFNHPDLKIENASLLRNTITITIANQKVHTLGKWWQATIELPILNDTIYNQHSFAFDVKAFESACLAYLNARKNELIRVMVRIPAEATGSLSSINYVSDVPMSSIVLTGKRDELLPAHIVSPAVIDPSMFSANVLSP